MSSTKETRRASIRASIASGDGGIDLASCDEATREILKDFDFDKNGFISKDEVTMGANLFQKSLKENEQFKKMILCLILGYVVFCLTLGGLIYGIVKANEQVRVDPLTGITTTTGGGDAVIMKTAPALVVRKDTSVHNVTIADLNALEKIVFFDGTISFNVMGFARKEDETVILVQGGSLTFNMDGLFNHTGVEPALLFDHVSDGERELWFDSIAFEAWFKKTF